MLSRWGSGLERFKLMQVGIALFLSLYVDFEVRPLLSARLCGVWVDAGRDCVISASAPEFVDVVGGVDHVESASARRIQPKASSSQSGVTRPTSSMPNVDAQRRSGTG